MSVTSAHGWLWLMWLLAACGAQPGARATGGGFAAKLDAGTAGSPSEGPADAALPPGCVTDDPGGSVTEAYARVSCWEVNRAQGDAGSESAAPGCLSSSEHSDGTITLETQLDFSNSPTFADLGFDGPTNHGTPGRCSLQFPTSYTCTNLVGQTLTYQAAFCWLDCLGGEPGTAHVAVTRDSAGMLLAVYAGIVTLAGGEVLYFPELTPEFTLRWVMQPQEACSLRRLGLELTVTKTGEKIVGEWERRTAVDIDGQHYVLVVATIREPSAGVCGSLTALLYRTDFLYPK